MKTKLVDFLKKGVALVNPVKEYAGSIVRHVITTGGGALAAEGLLDKDDVSALAGAGVVIFGVLLSFLNKYFAKKAAAV
jgi:hypothetical protein